MNQLSKTLFSTSPREKAGSRTAARYAFQAHASIYKMLERHETGADYRALFDHFDDLAMLNAGLNPSEIELYQIKGKSSGKWTSNQLAKEKAGATPPKSIIGKMYHHTVSLGDAVSKCIFLSNASFKMKLASGSPTTDSHTVINFVDLGSDDKVVLSAPLEKDFPSPRDPSEDLIFRFEITSVPIVGYDLIIKGKLVDLVNTASGTSVSALYKTLVAEVDSKSANTQECNSLEELLSRKSLSRADIEGVLSEALNRNSILEHWSVVEGELNTAGWSSTDRIRQKTAVMTFVHQLSVGQSSGVSLHETTAVALAALTDPIPSDGSILSMANAIQNNLSLSHDADPDNFRKYAACLVRAFEALQ